MSKTMGRSKSTFSLQKLTISGICYSNGKLTDAHIQHKDATADFEYMHHLASWVNYSPFYRMVISFSPLCEQTKTQSKRFYS